MPSVTAKQLDSNALGRGLPRTLGQQHNDSLTLQALGNWHRPTTDSTVCDERSVHRSLREVMSLRQVLKS